MKKRIGHLSYTFINLVIALCCNAQSEHFMLNQKLYQKFLPSLEDSGNLLIGINYQLNDFERYDGNVVQMACRFKPYSDNPSVRSIEFGLNVNGYFNQYFYWFNSAGNYSTRGKVDGYNASASVWKPISIRKSQLFISFSPGLNVIKRLHFTKDNGKYVYDYNRYSTEFSGDVSLVWRITKFELFYNYYYNPISQNYIDMSNHVDKFRNLYDSSKTYYFRADVPGIKYSIEYSNYGLIYHSRINSNQLNFYCYTDLWGFSIGTNYSYKNLSINPEYTHYPYFYYPDYFGYQVGIMMGYEFYNGLSIKGAFLFTERVWGSRKTRGVLGLELKI